MKLKENQIVTEMEKQYVARVIRPDGTETEVKSAKAFTLTQLQEFVGGYLELVHLKPGNGRGVVYVNEEGKLHGLSRNDKATALVVLRPDDHIVGNMVIVTRR